MAIEKEIKIVVKETGLDDVNKKVNQLEKSIESNSNAQLKSSKISKEQVDAIKELAPTTTNAVQSLLSMGKAMWALVANPLGLVLAAIAAAVGVLFLAFKSFQPVVDKVEQVFTGLGAAVNVVKNVFIAVTTGTKSLGDAFSSLGSDMSDAAKRTMELVKAQQDLEDAMKSQEITTSKNRAEINRLNVELRNRTLSEKERLKIADEIVKKENQDFLQRKKLVDEEVRQAREAIAIKAQFTAKERKLLKETGDATKELAESRGGNYDKEYDRLNAARKKAIELEDEVTVNIEKAYNRRDKLEDDRAEKEQRRLDKIAEEKEKAKQKAIKEEEEQETKRLKEAEDYNNSLKEQLKNEADLKAETIKAIDEAQEKENEFKISAQEKEIQDVNDKYFTLIENAKKFNLDTTQLENAKLNDINNINLKYQEAEYEQNKKINEQKIKDEELLRDAKYNIANQTLSLISEIAGKGSKLSKAIAISQATISGVEGVQNAFTTAQKSPITTLFPAYPFVQAGLAGAFSALQIAKIAKGEKASAGSSSSSGGGSPQAPSFNLVQGTGRNQIAEGLNKQAPIKAYVVPTDVSTGQSMDRNIIKSATL